MGERLKRSGSYRWQRLRGAVLGDLGGQAGCSLPPPASRPGGPPGPQRLPAGAGRGGGGGGAGCPGRGLSVRGGGAGRPRPPRLSARRAGRLAVPAQGPRPRRASAGRAQPLGPALPGGALRSCWTGSSGGGVGASGAGTRPPSATKRSKSTPKTRRGEPAPARLATGSRFIAHGPGPRGRPAVPSGCGFPPRPQLPAQPPRPKGEALPVQPPLGPFPGDRGACGEKAGV